MLKSPPLLARLVPIVVFWTLLLPPAPGLSSAKLIGLVSAYSADDFVDSEGVNTQFYLKSYFLDPKLPAFVKSLGIRHVRDDIIKGDSREIARLNHLSSVAGVRFDLITDGGDKAFGQNAQSANDIEAFVKAVPAAEAIEAPNEYDLRGPGWLQSLLPYLPTLKAARTGLDVYGPAFTKLSSYDEAGNLAGYEDYSNFHNYFPGYPPENSGFGANFDSCGASQSAPCGRYGSLEFEKQQVAIEGPGQPIVCTETGYGTMSRLHEIDESTQSKYLPRLLLNQFAKGIRRTYIFQLVDHYAEHAAFGSYGLLTASTDYKTHEPKPAYRVLEKMNQLLADPGPRFSPSPLVMSLDDPDPTTQSVLLGKRDGSYWLAIWNSSASFDVERVLPESIPVAEHQAILRLAVAKEVTVFSFDAAGDSFRRKLSKARHVTLDISDGVTLYRIR